MTVANRYDTFFTLSVDMLCIANGEGYFEELNPAWTEILGWSREELKAEPFLSFVHPEDVPATLAEVDKLAQGHKTINFMNRYRTPDGSWRWLDWTAGPDPRTGKLYAIARDVTVTRDLQTELVAAREEAEEANRAKSQFLANMSHELRTPLNAIIGYSEMLQEEAEDDSLPQYVADLSRVTRAGRQLLGLINEVLDLAKVEAGRVDLFFEPLNLHTVVASVVDTVQPILAANGNALVVEGFKALGTVTGDQVRVRQILTNLLANAAKFTANGTITVTGRWADGLQQSVSITVADSGIGMSAEQLDKVFEPFVQADASTTRRYGGTGLGLAITRKFVTLLGGTIEVQSVPGEGTTVEVVLPAVEPSPTAGGEESVSLSPVSGSHPALDSTSPLILVVDDDAVSRSLLRRVLEKGGYRVLTARDGEQAVQLARQYRPALVTLDIMMPGIDGWGAMRLLRAEPELKDTPVLMCSVLDERRLAVAVGADAYLQKPVNRDALLSLVETHLGAPGSRVLVVDDDADARDLTGRRLKDAGYEVHFAKNGVEAMQFVETSAGPPDLIVLDLMMPEMDGFEVLARLEDTRGETAAVPVVVVTAKDLDANDHARFTRQVQQVLQKSMGPTDALLKAVERALGKPHAKQGGQR